MEYAGVGRPRPCVFSVTETLLCPNPWKLSSRNIYPSRFYNFVLLCALVKLSIHNICIIKIMNPKEKNSAATKKPMTGAEALIRCLENFGVEYIWGLSGGAAIPIFDALVGSKIDRKSTRLNS